MSSDRGRATDGQTSQSTQAGKQTDRPVDGQPDSQPGGQHQGAPGAFPLSAQPPGPPPPGDWRLLGAEIRASIAYADALAEAGAFSRGECDQIVKSLKQIEADYRGGRWRPDERDLFAALDERLEQIGGPGVSKFNAARARGEQTMTTLRLWLLDEMEALVEVVADIQRALIDQAEGHVGALMPGYTHFQPAQVVSCSHWLLSYFWMLTRDQDRLAAAIGRASVCPLGSGLLAGSPYPIDRAALAVALGFSDAAANSMDAVSDMDFAAEFLFVAVMLGIHLSRFAEDLTLYANPALGFVSIDPQYSAGAGLQQNNPEAVELSRGKAGRLLGELTGFLSTLKSLPSAYNQDTQENRAVLFLAADTLTSLLNVMNSVIRSLTINPDRMVDALDERMLSGDVVDYLVTRGVGHREARAIVDRLNQKAERTNRPLSDLELSVFQAESPVFDADLFATLDFNRSATRRSTLGGTAPAAVRAQIRQALDWLVEAGLE